MNPLKQSMKKLSQLLFSQINNYMNTEARLLEKALFNYYFNNNGSNDVLDALEAFQNQDGGFGQGIEPDFKLPQSSPMATTIGLKYLSRLDENDRAQRMIARAVTYLESTFDSIRNGWYCVPSIVNEYPHAPWWEFSSETKMVPIDYSWGNPTAELLGYLFKYRKYINNLDIDSLVSNAINKLNDKVEFKSEHEIFCYIRMYNELDERLSGEIEDKLNLAVSKLVSLNQDEWENYVPSPLKFIQIDSDNYFGIERKYIDQNLDYLIDKLEHNGKILPNWCWDKYQEQWEISKVEWTGVLTFETLLHLLKFNRV